MTAVEAVMRCGKSLPRRSPKRPLPPAQMAPAKPKSALRTAASGGGGRTCKRVRWKENLVQHLDGAGAAPAAAPPPSGFQFAQLTTVSRKAVTPLFNIPTTAHRNANAKKRLWGEAWPSPAPPDDDGGDDDGAYETVLEWFCDECQAPIPDDATRYECAVCPADYCRCAACYRAGVVGGRNAHVHALAPSSKPYHASNPPPAPAPPPPIPV